MTIIIVQFDYANRKGMYARLLKVLLKSISINAPDANVISLSTPPPKVHGKVCFSSNNYKLKMWLTELEKLPDGENVLFLDADMLCLKDPVKIYEQEFDIAYTTRTRGHRIPINGGAVYCKNNQNTRDFIKRWQAIDDKMFHNPTFHRPYRQKYAGQNQASFGWMLEHPKEHQAKLIPVPCAMWNCCNDSWRAINENTHFVHIKGPLRQACLKNTINSHLVSHAARLWFEYLEKTGEKPSVRVAMSRQIAPRTGPRPIKKFRPVPQLPKPTGVRHSLSQMRHVSIADLRGK